MRLKIKKNVVRGRFDVLFNIIKENFLSLEVFIIKIIMFYFNNIRLLMLKYY